MKGRAAVSAERLSSYAIQILGQSAFGQFQTRSRCRGREFILREYPTLPSIMRTVLLNMEALLFASEVQRRLVIWAGLFHVLLHSPHCWPAS